MDMTLTPAAQKFFRRLLRFDGGPGSGLRLSVAPGGCSGLAAEFSVEAAPRPGDGVFEIDGVRLFLPAESRLLLDRVTVDFVDTPRQTGLVFHDPKSAGSSCSTATPLVTLSVPAAAS
ncbi:MAG TPA: iron-sulfur cluster assembly accessory protein [Acidisphaera sp.]|nr:iron-sulfur cluster assembly accessory protein [Acidisphaera sp.]